MNLRLQKGETIKFDIDMFLLVERVVTPAVHSRDIFPELVLFFFFAALGLSSFCVHLLSSVCFMNSHRSNLLFITLTVLLAMIHLNHFYNKNTKRKKNSSEVETTLGFHLSVNFIIFSFFFQVFIKFPQNLIYISSESFCFVLFFI